MLVAAVHAKPRSSFGCIMSKRLSAKHVFKQLDHTMLSIIRLQNDAEGHQPEKVNPIVTVEENQFAEAYDELCTVQKDVSNLRIKHADLEEKLDGLNRRCEDNLNDCKRNADQVHVLRLQYERLEEKLDEMDQVLDSNKAKPETKNTCTFVCMLFALGLYTCSAYQNVREIIGESMGDCFGDLAMFQSLHPDTEHLQYFSVTMLVLVLLLAMWLGKTTSVLVFGFCIHFLCYNSTVSYPNMLSNIS